MTLLTPKEAAQRLNTSVGYIRDHLADLGGFRLHDGPRAPLRIPLDSLELYLEHRKAEAETRLAVCHTTKRFAAGACGARLYT